VQLYREGPNDKIITFLEVDRFAQKLTIPEAAKQVPELAYLGGSNFQTLIHSEKLGTEYALLESRRPDADRRLPPDQPGDGRPILCISMRRRSRLWAFVRDQIHMISRQCSLARMRRML